MNSKEIPEIPSKFLGNKNILIVEFIDMLNETFGKKTTGKSFNRNDITSYIRRGHLPYSYGDYTVTANKNGGILLINIYKKK